MVSPGFLRLPDSAVCRWWLRDLQGKVPSAGPLSLGTENLLPLPALPLLFLVLLCQGQGRPYRGGSRDAVPAQGSGKPISEGDRRPLSWPQEEGRSEGSPRVLPDSGTQEPPSEIQEGSMQGEEGDCQAPSKARGNWPLCSMDTLQGSQMCVVRSSLIKTLVTDIAGSESGHCVSVTAHLKVS